MGKCSCRQRGEVVDVRQIPERSLKIWSSAPSSSTPSFIAMTLAGEPERRAGSCIVVHAPSGVRIEGLNVGIRCTEHVWRAPAEARTLGAWT